MDHSWNKRLGRNLITGLAVAIVLAGLALTVLYLYTPSRHALRVTSRTTPADKPFPRDFLWGAAIAGQQAESQQPSDWTAFEEDAFRNGRFKAGDGYVSTLPGHIRDLGQWSDEVRREKSAFDTYFEQDIAMTADAGLNALRVSVEWSRLFPRAGMSSPDPDGVAYYKALFATMQAHHIRPIATLFHFVSPAWFFDADETGKRGWERADALRHWRTFVAAVAENFVGDVSIWCTLNEPMVYLQSGYIDGAFPPLERRKDFAAVAEVYAALLAAHGIAYDLLHEAAARRGVEASVGITQSVIAFAPLRNWHPIDHLVAGLVARAWNRDFLDAIQTGRMRLAATRIDREIAGLQGKQDYVGVNYYMRLYVKGNLFHPAEPEILYVDPAHPEEPVTDMGWLIYPRGLRERITEVSTRYGKPVYVLENGAADEQDNDTIRQAYVPAHLREVWLAIQDGADVRGYMAWSLLDNFEWAEGFGPRFGMMAVDYANGFKRTPRPSFAQYGAIARANALPTAN